MGGRPPGPLCAKQLGPFWVDNGTMCRTRSTSPGPLGSVRFVGKLAEPSNEIARAWRDLIANTAEVFGGGSSQDVPAPVSPKIEKPDDIMSKGRDLGIDLSTKYVGGVGERLAERGKELAKVGEELSDGEMSRRGTELSKAGARLKFIANSIGAVANLYSVYQFVTKGEGSYGDMGAIAADLLAEHASNIGVRVAGRAFAFAWMVKGAFELGTAIAAEAEADEIRKSLIEEILHDAYFSFMNKGVWLHYWAYLADQRTEANEFNVSRPKGLKVGVGGQIFEIEQKINGLLYSRLKNELSWAALFPNSPEQCAYEAAHSNMAGPRTAYTVFMEAKGACDEASARHEHQKRVRDEITPMLDQIDRINLDMNNWAN